MDIDILKNIVKEADNIFFDSNLRGDISKKGDSDFVTKADIAVSNYMYKRLKEEFADIGFISEEEEYTKIDKNKDYWILDPIDGTTNFIHGIRECAISIGLYSKGEIIMGVIYVPYTKELFWAEKGNGAFLNDEQIYCSKNKKLEDSVGIFVYNAYFKNEADVAFNQAKKMFMACQDIRSFGSSAVELAYVACGRADVYWGRYLKPWDFAAARVLINEAGGVMLNTEGKIDFFEINQTIVATNGYVYNEFVEIMA